ncbi:MAG TPA: hypothetical protein VGL91_05450 [Acidobacteriota bacterium]
MSFVVVVTQIVFALSLCSFGGEMQQNDDYYAINLVDNLLRQSGDFNVSATEKQLNRLGDRVSIALLKILDEKALSDPRKLRRILPLIRGAFVRPEIVPIREDRKPKITLFLLRHLGKVSDPAIQEQIIQTTQFVKDQTAK